MNTWWRCTITITIPTTMTTLPITLTATLSTSTRTFECNFSCFSCVNTSSHCSHTSWFKSWVLCSPVIASTFVKWRTLLRLFALPFYFSLFLSHSFHFFPHLKLVNNLLRIPPKKEYGLFWRDLHPHKNAYRKKPTDETSDTNCDVKTKTITKHMKRDTWQVNVHVVFFLVHVVVILTLGTPDRVAQVGVLALI